MALSVLDIFPLPGDLAEGYGSLLEPKSSIRTPNSPTLLTPTEARVLFRKRSMKTFYRYEYAYENILQWEYILLENFFKRMKGRYTEFYLVDWSNPFKISSCTSRTPNAQLVLNHLDSLTASTGYLGNKVLIYNPLLYNQLNKKILTISTITTNTSTVTFTSDLDTSLYSIRSRIYVLVPAIFDCDDLKYTEGGFCIEDTIHTFGNFGAKSIYGPVVSVNIPFLQLGVVKDI